MSHLEQITNEQLEQAIDNVKNTDYLRQKAGALTSMMRMYGPRLADSLAKEGPETIQEVMNSYLNGLYREFQTQFWKAVSVDAFVGQMTKIAIDLFPNLEDELRQWENTDGKDFTARYHEWNKEARPY